MTRIAIIGAHGKVGQQLMRLLYDRGDDFVGIVRSAEHAEDVYRLGGHGSVIDIESATAEQLAGAITGCEAVVFTAGAGAGSGVERKQSVDYGGSVLAAAAAQHAGIRRFIQVSAWGVDHPVAADADATWAAYVAAKRDADAALARSTLDWTILRPGGLTAEDGTGRVMLADAVERGSIPREDVARLIIASILEPRSIGHTWEAVSGDTPIDQAVGALIAAKS
ncbi:MAG TPA: SDR family oxidoreductase [Microbacteriaceae bacterium]